MSGEVVINNPAFGIGDAVVFCWLLKSANEGGGVPTKIIPRRLHDVFRLFGCEQYLLPDEDHPFMISTWPSKGVVGGRNWLENWLHGYGCGPCTLVRPSPSHHARDLAEAEAMWLGRQKATGGGRRVLIFPEALYGVRNWNESGFSRVASVLESRGLATITMFQKYRPHKFPFAYGGLSFRLMCALIQRADLVLGCESGPAHLSITMEKQTAVMYGPTRPDLMHGHSIQHVIPFTGRGPCVGCNFQVDRGYRTLCHGSCDTIKTIDPWHVAETLMTPDERNNVLNTAVFAAKSRPIGMTAMKQAAIQAVTKSHTVEVTVGGGLDRGVSADPTFMEKMCDIIRSRCISRIVETGTYDGRGSTLHLANALPREGGRLVTIECDEKRAEMAAAFHKEHGNPHVDVWHGLSLLRESLPTLEQLRADAEETVKEGFAVDGKFPHTAASFYLKETDKREIPEDQLMMALTTVLPELVFLDSAGGVGWLEWQLVRDWAKPGLLVGMDDVKHIKHWRSLKDAKERGWKVLLEDDRRYGAVLLEAP